MSDDEVEALADQIAGLALEAQVRVLLGMLEKVSADRDRLRAVVDGVLSALSQTVEDVCHDDTLVVANLYARLAAQLDVSPAMGGTDSVGGRRLTVAVEPTDHRGAGDATPGTPSETPDTGGAE